MQGVGNDFVVVEANQAFAPAATPQRLAIYACDRKTGVGADGLLLLTRFGRGMGDDRTAFGFRMFNPDGTEDMCGNGLRCAGLWALRRGWLDSGAFSVATKDGPRAVRIISVEEGCHSATLGVDMGPPRFRPDDIPFAAGGVDAVREFPLVVADREFSVTSVNTGSTHTVIFGPQPSEEVFRRYSPLIEEHPLFPERTSVLWSTPFEPMGTHPRGRAPLRVQTRIWERGAGETLGCGTGACAVAVAAQVLGIATPGQVVQVVSRGGTLAIGWGGGTCSVDMVGPAVIVFEGELTSE